MRAIRTILDFLGWWLLWTLALCQSLLGWFTPLFAQPWHMLAAGAALALLITAATASA